MVIAMIRLPALALLVALALPDSAPGERAPTPDFVEDVMAHLGFGPQNRASLEAGEILFTGQPDFETLPEAIAVAGAMMLIGRPPGELVDAYLSDAVLRSHSDVLMVGSAPEVGGDASDLASLEYSEDEQKEVRRLRRSLQKQSTKVARSRKVSECKCIRTRSPGSHSVARARRGASRRSGMPAS